MISVSENTWQDETKAQGIIEWYKVKEVKEKKEAKSKDLF